MIIDHRTKRLIRLTSAALRLAGLRHVRCKQDKETLMLDKEAKTMSGEVAPVATEKPIAHAAATTGERGWKHSELRVALVTGCIALVAALAGAAVSGYFSLRSQEITAKQQEVLFSRQMAANERQSLRKAISEYIESFSEYYAMLTSTSIKEAEVDAFAKKIFVSATEITLLFSVDLGHKTFELNATLLNNLKAKVRGTYSDQMDQTMMKQISEWALIAKGEYKLLEYSSTPDTLQSDLMRLFMKSATTKYKRI